jgi:signal transduction histidine kinase
VVVNVIKNAIEATPEGGRIEVATSFGSGRLAVKVTDGGPGVPDEDRRRIFEPFFTTKKGGMGLGLCVSQAIVEEHGGSIRLETAPEGGAVFVIELPVERSHGEDTDC